MSFFENWIESKLREIVTPDMVSLWTPAGQNGAKDIIRGNHGTTFGTHPNVPVITSDSTFGSLNYDNLSGTFVVREWIIDGTSKAQGEIKSDNGSTLELENCSGRFHDNEQITGSISGATANVNHPKTGVGVDLIRNGEFEVDGSPSGWQAMEEALLTTEADGKIGNCIMVTGNGRITPYARQTIGGLSSTKIYKFKASVKAGTEASYGIELKAYPLGISFKNFGGEAAGDWSTEASSLIEIPENCTSLQVRLKQMCAEGAGTTLYFDEVSFYEVSRSFLINPSVGWVFGGDDRIHLPSLPTIVAPYSVGCWFYPRELGRYQTIICLGGGNSSSYPYFTIHRTTNRLMMYTPRRAYVQRVLDTGDLNKWWCIEFVLGSQLLADWRVRLNGEEMPLSTNADTYNEPGTYGSIGSRLLGDYLNGYMALPFVSWGARSLAQSKNHYLNTKGMFAPRGVV